MRTTYSLTEEQAFCLADPDNAIFAPGGFLFALGALKGEERVAEAIPHRHGHRLARG